MYGPLFQLENNGGCLVLPAETEAGLTAKVSSRAVTDSPRSLAAKLAS